MKHNYKTITIEPAILDAYRATHYEIRAPGGQVILSVGKPARLALEKVGISCDRLAIITAWNPFSQMMSASENNHRQGRLEREIIRAGLCFYPALGRDPSGQWPAEPSFAILDPSDNILDDWMLAFGQNAVVVADNTGDNVGLWFHPHETSRIGLDQWTAQRSVARLWAQAWQSFGPDLVKQALHPSISYESQWVFSAMEGRNAVTEYLDCKMDACRKVASDPARRLLVKIGEVTSGSPAGKPCVVMFQGQSDSPATVILFELDQGQIARVDVCIPQLYAPRILSELDQHSAPNQTPA